MTKPLVTIIVPVYKVERYLSRCIESILGQTYSNFELILVDDGTPDRSGIICDRYAEKDFRIKVIHKENGGVSSARNAGIDVAQGEWITFVDSDDWVSENYLEVLLDPLSEGDYQLLVGSKENRGLTVTKSSALIQKITIANLKRYEDIDVFNNVEFMETYIKLFLRSIIVKNSLRFSEGVSVAEDAIFVTKYLGFCQKIYLTGKTIYYYNRLNSLATTNTYRYFEDRAQWDFEYINSWSETLNAWGVDKQVKQIMLDKKNLSGFIAVSKAIVFNLPPDEAQKKLKETCDEYSSKLSHEEYWKLLPNHSQYCEVVKNIQNRSVDILYNSLSSQKRGKVYTRCKNLIKRAIRPFLERYRDGLKNAKRFSEDSI